MDWQISILQKDITYYFKYRAFSGIFAINDHISDNSIQINTKFTFTVYKYIIVYEFILLSNFYIYTYKYIYIYIYIFITSRNSLPTCEHDPSYQ